MNKIDLIIEAIRLAEYNVKVRGWGDDIDLELYTEALVAALELQALKPVAITLIDGAALFDGVVLPDETLLYALDEVTK